LPSRNPARFRPENRFARETNVVLDGRYVQIAPLPLALKLVPEPTDATTVFDDDNRHILILGVNQFFGHLAPPFD
jgi:hypothetical protein